MKKLLILLSILAQSLAAQQLINGSSVQVGTVNYCADAGASDTYACNLTPALPAYVSGAVYRFKANTANTGASTINFNSLGAKTIKKAAGGVTTDLDDNDIRAGQVVDLVYDGTNMQMQSLLGNAGGGGSAGGSSGEIQYNNAGAFGGVLSLTRAGSGASEAIQLYNSTATTGLTKLTIRSGAGQTGTPTVLSMADTGNTERLRVRDIGAGDYRFEVTKVADLGDTWLRGVGADTFASTFTGCWKSGGSWFTGSTDLCVARKSAGLYELNNGTAIGTTVGNARHIIVGQSRLAEQSADPSASDLTVAGSNTLDVVAAYMKNNKLVFAYNNAGTVTYISIPLDGSTTTWTHSTSAP